MIIETDRFLFQLLERKNAEGVFNILKNPKTNFVIMKKLERDIDKKEKKIKELETKLFDKKNILI